MTMTVVWLPLYSQSYIILIEAIAPVVQRVFSKNRSHWISNNSEQIKSNRFFEKRAG